MNAFEQHPISPEFFLRQVKQHYPSNLRNILQPLDPSVVELRRNMDTIYSFDLPASPGMIGLHGILLPIQLTHQELDLLNLSHEFHEIPVFAHMLCLDVQIDTKQRHMRMNDQDDTDTLSFLLDSEHVQIAGAPEPMSKIFHEKILKCFALGVLHNANMRFLLRKEFLKHFPKPILFIIGHGGRSPKLIGDKDYQLSQDSLDHMLHYVSATDYAAVIDGTCSLLKSDMPILPRSSPAYFGSRGKVTTNESHPTVALLPQKTPQLFLPNY